jgi:hypothetical protein
MRAQEADQLLTAKAASLREVTVHPPVEPLMHAAREVASDIRVTASRAGHSVGVRLVERDGGVRITVTGPQANRYRLMMEKAMQTRLPGARAEIRSMITRRVK